MEKASLPYLLDTNILLRLSKRESPEFATIRTALKALSQQNARLCYTSQNLIEFWNVATRPIDRNGYGLSTEEVNVAASRIERAFILLPDNEIIHHEWKKLVVTYGVSGAKVHDARIIAAMMVHKVSHILTLNDRDFSRYAGITAMHPGSIPVR
jgi:predicted nucleic acid-binding protein